MKTSQKIYLLIKRFLGIVLSLVGMAFCLALLWWWIFPIDLVVTKGHPFFAQRRLGKHKKEFSLLKFRSMKKEADPNLPPYDILTEEQLRMETGFGRFLRKTSLDETPQLINIFLGQMAFIGPRPGAAKNEDYLIKERESFSPNAYDVRPGLSGLAQVKMGCGHDPKLKAYYDHEYAKSVSLSLDLRLFVLTLSWAIQGGNYRSSKEIVAPNDTANVDNPALKEEKNKTGE